MKWHCSLPKQNPHVFEQFCPYIRLSHSINVISQSSNSNHTYPWPFFKLGNNLPFFHYKYLYVWKTKKLYPDWYCIIQEILYLYHKLFPSIPLDIHPHIVLSPCYISLVQNSWYYTCPCNCNHSDQPGILKGYILTVTLNHVKVGNGKILFSFFQM